MNMNAVQVYLGIPNFRCEVAVHQTESTRHLSIGQIQKGGQMKCVLLDILTVDVLIQRYFVNLSEAIERRERVKIAIPLSEQRQLNISNKEPFEGISFQETSRLGPNSQHWTAYHSVFMTRRDFHFFSMNLPTIILELHARPESVNHELDGLVYGLHCLMSRIETQFLVGRESERFVDCVMAFQPFINLCGDYAYPGALANAVNVEMAKHGLNYHLHADKLEKIFPEPCEVMNLFFSSNAIWLATKTEKTKQNTNCADLELSRFDFVLMPLFPYRLKLLKKTLSSLRYRGAHRTISPTLEEYLPKRTYKELCVGLPEGLAAKFRGKDGQLNAKIRKHGGDTEVQGYYMPSGWTDAEYVMREVIPSTQFVPKEVFLPRMTNAPPYSPSPSEQSPSTPIDPTASSYLAMNDQLDSMSGIPKHPNTISAQNAILSNPDEIVGANTNADDGNEQLNTLANYL